MNNKKNHGVNVPIKNNMEKGNAGKMQACPPI